MKIQHDKTMHVSLGHLIPGKVYLANESTYMVTGIEGDSGRVISVNLATGAPSDRPESYMVTPCPEAVLHTHQIDPLIKDN